MARTWIAPLVAYISILMVFAALDFTWLSLTGPSLYKPALGPLLAAKVRVAPAIAFYVVYLAGLVYFAVWPALTGGGWSRALINGAILGVVAYATYDLTNQATLRIWSVRVTLLDLCWGAFASALAALVSFSITAWVARAIR
jgi:uncharacterized membrane protein